MEDLVIYPNAYVRSDDIDAFRNGASGDCLPGIRIWHTVVFLPQSHGSTSIDQVACTKNHFAVPLEPIAEGSGFIAQEPQRITSSQHVLQCVAYI